MKTYLLSTIALAAIQIATGGSALAHVSLAPGSAPAGSTYKAVLGIGHGCDGATTEAVRVRLPEGFVAAKPMPKAGWDLEVVQGKYTRTYDYYGTPMSEGPVEIVWSGGALDDAWYDEFAVRGRLDPSTAGSRLPFVTVQECGEATLSWDMIAADGQDPHALDHPAPLLQVAAAEQHHGHGGNGSAAADMPIRIQHAWARETSASAANGASYLVIENHGDHADRLVAVSSPVAGKVELHTNIMDNGVMKMRPLEHGIELPAGGHAEMKPGGDHVMLLGLKAPLKEGETFPLTLTFEKAGEVEVMVHIMDVAHGGKAAHKH